MHKNKNITKIISVMVKCIELINEFSKGYIIITTITMVFLGMAPIIAVRIMQKIINAIQLQTSSLENIYTLLIIYISIQILNSVCLEIYNYYSAEKRLYFAQFTDEILLQKATSLGLSDFEDDETYNIINRAQGQGGDSVLIFFDNFINIFRSIVTIISSLYILSQYSLVIVFIAIVIPVFQYLYSLKIGRLKYNISIKRTNQERKAWYINFLIMTGSAYKEIRLNGLSEYLIHIYSGIKIKIIEQDIEILKRTSVVDTILNFIDHVISGGITAKFIYEGFYKKILLGDMTTYTNCLYTIKNNVTTIFTQMSSLINDSMFITLFFDFLALDIDEKSGEIQIDKIREVELCHVSYKYKGSKKYSLTDCNLKIRSGDKMAIIGLNGSGKSTLMKLILGFYDDYEGEILINGISLRKIDRRVFRKKVGSIFQDFVKYESTLKDNVGFGNLNVLNNDDEILRALEFAEVNEKIYQNCGIDTMLGNWFGKKQVSVGEWQRIAIARAFIKKADMYILDEPDASLDVLTTKKMLTKYRKVLEECIGILITHKVHHVHLFATVIVVLENGEIVECGSHDELLSRKDRYYEMYTNDR